jgi:glycosyltransferase involved in cell wall biosynthesis
VLFVAGSLGGGGAERRLIDLLRSRVPGVVADCPTGPREILEDGRLGSLVPAENVDALAGAIRNVLQAPPSPEELEAARQSVIERFGMTAGIRRLEDLLQRVTTAESGR